MEYFCFDYYLSKGLFKFWFVYFTWYLFYGADVGFGYGNYADVGFGNYADVGFGNYVDVGFGNYVDVGFNLDSYFLSFLNFLFSFLEIVLLAKVGTPIASSSLSSLILNFSSSSSSSK